MNPYEVYPWRIGSNEGYRKVTPWINTNGWIARRWEFAWISSFHTLLIGPVSFKERLGPINLPCKVYIDSVETS